MNGILDGDQIRRIRQIRNLSQAGFAARLGYSKSYVEKLEKGEKPVTREFCDSIDKFYNLERSYREACLTYSATQARLNKRTNYFFWISLIIMVLILVILY